MTRRCLTLLATLVTTFFNVAAATAQDAARQAPPDATATPGWVLLIIPVVFIALIIPIMRRSKKMQPLMDRSLEIGEENLRLLKEHVAL
jgi:hypothetical protein